MPMAWPPARPLSPPKHDDPLAGEALAFTVQAAHEALARRMPAGAQQGNDSALSFAPFRIR